MKSGGPPSSMDIPPPTYETSTSSVPPPAGWNPPPPQSYPPPPPPPTATVFMSPTGGAPMVVTARTSVYGPHPVEMDCPNCQKHIVTHIDRIAGALPWLIAGVCFVLGFFLLIPWCLCFIPFCVDSCLDVVHSCPSCRHTLGRFNRM